MRHRVVVGMGLMLAMLSLGLPGRAQEWKMGEHVPGGLPGGRMLPKLMAMLENDRVKAELGLTDEQVSRLRQITVDTEKSTVKVGADLAVQGIELRELLRADKPDRDAVMKKVQEISDLRGEMMKQHVEALLAAKTVLTPEQQKKIRAFIERRAAAEPWREKMMERRRLAPPPPAGPPAPPHKPAEPPVR